VLPAGTTATTITAGGNHTCAVLNTGTLTCWGSNFVGQLGNPTNAGTGNPNPTPTAVVLPAATTATTI
jgi:alpha-tubulin suppressor-like RCC1 family protein